MDDLDANEKLDPLIFYNFNGQQIPWAAKDQLASQLPLVKKRFTNYRDFAQVRDFENLTGKSRDSVLQILSLQELRSMVFLQDSLGKFTAKPLPAEAQFSPIEDFYVPEKAQQSVYFVGNNSSFVTALGGSNAQAGGELYWNSNAFVFKDVFENLPTHAESRAILPLNTQECLILTNNGPSYRAKN